MRVIVSPVTQTSAVTGSSPDPSATVPPTNHMSVIQAAPKRTTASSTVVNSLCANVLNSGECVNGGTVRSPAGEGKERLLQALFEEFGASGPNPTLSMRQVAQRLGVHHTLLTYHFG